MHMSDAITSRKIEQGGGVSFVLSPAYECEMKGSLVYLLIVKYLSILFKFSPSILDWTILSRNIFGLLKIFF